MSSNFVGRVCFAGALAALLLGCGEKEPLSTAYRDAYAEHIDDVQAGLASGWCQVEKTCGALSYVNCNSEADGPSYYVDFGREQVLELCGGSCGIGPGVGGSCMQCPPPEWTCTP
jgi:hypothetical protein